MYLCGHSRDPNSDQAETRVYARNESCQSVFILVYRSVIFIHTSLASLDVIVIPLCLPVLPFSFSRLLYSLSSHTNLIFCVHYSLGPVALHGICDSVTETGATVVLKKLIPTFVFLIISYVYSFLLFLAIDRTK